MFTWPETCFRVLPCLVSQISLKCIHSRCAFIEILCHYHAHLDDSNAHIEKYQELKPISPPESQVPAVDLRDSPPKLQLYRHNNGYVTRFDSTPESLIPPPEPQRPPTPPSESPIPLPEFSVYLTESQFSTTEHPGPLSEPLVSSLKPPVPLLNSGSTAGFPIHGRHHRGGMPGTLPPGSKFRGMSPRNRDF